jgi:hypothetical protein
MFQNTKIQKKIKAQSSPLVLKRFVQAYRILFLCCDFVVQPMHLTSSKRVFFLNRSAWSAHRAKWGSGFLYPGGSGRRLGFGTRVFYLWTESYWSGRTLYSGKQLYINFKFQFEFLE